MDKCSLLFLLKTPRLQLDTLLLEVHFVKTRHISRVNQCQIMYKIKIFSNYNFTKCPWELRVVSFPYSWNEWRACKHLSCMLNWIWGHLHQPQSQLVLVLVSPFSCNIKIIYNEYSCVVIKLLQVQYISIEPLCYTSHLSKENICQLFIIFHCVHARINPPLLKIWTTHG